MRREFYEEVGLTISFGHFHSTYTLTYMARADSIDPSFNESVKVQSSRVFGATTQMSESEWS